jgi:hypothetical protein
MRPSRLGLILLLGLVVAACGAPAPTETPFNAAMPAEPAVTCLGAPPAKCLEIVQSTTANSAGARPVSIGVSCVAPVCNTAGGEVSVVVMFEDGSQATSGQGWASAVGRPAVAPAPAPPELPVRPICVGIDAARCREMAMTALDLGPSPETLRSITVVCERRCTEAAGHGTTHVVWDDGSSGEVMWDYEGSAGG